eukprot:3938954-Rhodomonas_salina.1
MLGWRKRGGETAGVCERESVGGAGAARFGSAGAGIHRGPGQLEAEFPRQHTYRGRNACVPVSYTHLRAHETEADL